MLAPSLLAVALCLELAPDEFDAERAATIEREQAKESAAINEKYGNKKSTELSREERSAMIRDQQAAEKKVLDKYGVSQKEWARAQMNRTRDQAAQVREADKALEAKEKAAEKAKAEKGGPKEIVIQKGISDDNPVVLEERESATPVVEHGLPKDFESDQAAATESDSAEKAAEAPAPRATGKGGKK
ncbi:MAG: hypothetical protein JNJ54_01960 [Myxococcaceae bacterium]|nr:hypothetical protein [Myxococcaceae bacterium]